VRSLRLQLAGIAFAGAVISASVLTVAFNIQMSNGESTNRALILPISVQPVNDGVSGTALILAPKTCQLSAGQVVAVGKYRWPVSEGYLRVGDVVELYVYSQARRGYPRGVQLAKLSQESRVSIGTQRRWSIKVPVELFLGSAKRCAVTVQATHQFEGAPNSY
jgi:hypothetical protein